MTINDLRRFFNVQTFSGLAKKLNVCKATVTNWNNAGIPIEQQAMLEVGTNGKLKADRNKIKIYD